MFRSAPLVLATGLLFAGHAVAEGEPDYLTTIERSYYRVLKPSAQDLRWREIPWIQNLDAAIKQAKKEKRPLFVWGTDDEPLERC